MTNTEYKCEYCGTDGECDCLERIYCEEKGYVGHILCGWCEQHNKPIFQCGLSCAKIKTEINHDNQTN